MKVSLFNGRFSNDSTKIGSCLHEQFGTRIVAVLLDEYAWTNEQITALSGFQPQQIDFCKELFDHPTAHARMVKLMERHFVDHGADSCVYTARSIAEQNIVSKPADQADIKAVASIITPFSRSWKTRVLDQMIEVANTAAKKAEADERAQMSQLAKKYGYRLIRFVG